MKFTFSFNVIKYMPNSYSVLSEIAEYISRFGNVQFLMLLLNR